MFNPFEVLGIPSTSSVDEAKKAYRKLAMEYHPDRVAQDRKKLSEEKFKTIKGAWELIDNGWSVPTPSSFASSSSPRGSWSKPEPAWEGMASGVFDAFNRQYTPRPRTPSSSRGMMARPSFVVEAYNEPEQRKNVGEFVARVSMAEAFNGFVCEVTIDDVKHRIDVPKGVPNGLRYTAAIAHREDVTIIPKFTESHFGFIGVNTALKEGVIVNGGPGFVFRTKDLTIALKLKATDIAKGCTVELDDFLGEKMTVKVPAGHNPKTPIRVEGHGYVDWYTSHSQAGENRGDVLVTIVPTQIPEPTMLT